MQTVAAAALAAAAAAAAVQVQQHQTDAHTVDYMTKATLRLYRAPFQSGYFA
jgi:hypothetical protein